MEFRPCIDIHNGQVKQIVGGSLKDRNDEAKENFVAKKGADYYAELYAAHHIKGGHIILLNPASSEYYEATRKQALRALEAYPQGLQIGGGIHAENATEYLDARASHVIVTSYVFKEGKIDFEHLKAIHESVGREHLVLDLSCRKKDGLYYIVTDRWQKFTEHVVNEETLNLLAPYCSEFLIHAVDVEGKASGIEEELASMLGVGDGIPITYAGGVGSLDDVELLKKLGNRRLDVTIGSALDIFGGTIPFEKAADIS